MVERDGSAVSVAMERPARKHTEATHGSQRNAGVDPLMRINRKDPMNIYCFLGLQRQHQPQCRRNNQRRASNTIEPTVLNDNGNKFPNKSTRDKIPSRRRSDNSRIDPRPTSQARGPKDVVIIGYYNTLVHSISPGNDRFRKPNILPGSTRLLLWIDISWISALLKQVLCHRLALWS